VYVFSDECIDHVPSCRRRKSYPQRHTRAKLNYRDLQRGMYENIRQAVWNLGSTSLSSKTHRNEQQHVDSMNEHDATSKDEQIKTISDPVRCIHCQNSDDHSMSMSECVSCPHRCLNDW
jgi:hypothetical protein